MGWEAFIIIGSTILPKREGSLGVRNFEASAKASHMKRLHYTCSNSDSIPISWIRDRYIQGRDFTTLVASPNKDSSMLNYPYA